MKATLLLALGLLSLVGCGGSSESSPAPRFAGSYQGSWVNVADPLDAGVSEWIIGENGSISGSDIDTTQEFSYTVLGGSDAAGNVYATTSLVGGDEVIALTGRLQFDSQGRLTGDLQWASEPPLTYRYTFTRETGG